MYRVRLEVVVHGQRDISNLMIKTLCKSQLYDRSLAHTICLSFGEVTVNSNDSGFISQVTSLTNDLNHLLITSFDVTSITNFY